MIDRSSKALRAGLGPGAAAWALAAALLAAALQPAGAQSSNAPKQEPPQVGGAETPPIDIKFDIVNGAARCEPPELRLPARTDVEVKITNTSDQIATITAPLLFRNEYVLHHEGDLAHVASNEGYTIKPRGTGRMKLRTPPPGEYEFSCFNAGTTGSPYKGKLILVQTRPN